MTVVLMDPNPVVVLTSPFPGIPRGISALGSASVQENLPAGLAVAPLPNSALATHLAPCTGSITNGTPGSTSLTFIVGFGSGDADIPNAFGRTCAWSIDLVVTGGSGTLTNTTAAPTSPNSIGAPGIPASASLNVSGLLPAIAAAFAGSPSVGGTTTLTITITNPNATPLTGVAFTDILSSAGAVANPSGLTNTCGGTANAPAGGSTITLTGGTVPANGTCQVVINVAGVSAGTLTNQVTSFSTNQFGAGTGTTVTTNVQSAPSAPTSSPTPLLPLFIPPAIPQVFQNPAAQGIFNGPRNPVTTPQRRPAAPAPGLPVPVTPVSISPPATGDAGLTSTR